MTSLNYIYEIRITKLGNVLIIDCYGHRNVSKLEHVVDVSIHTLQLLTSADPKSVDPMCPVCYSGTP